MAELILAIAIQKLGDFITETLNNYLTKEVVILNKVVSNVVWLQKELGYMLAFLKDAEEENEVQYRVRCWISDVQEIAKETTNVLREITLKMNGVPKNGCLEVVRSYACMPSRRAEIFDINDQIELLKATVLEISRRRDTYCIPDIAGKKLVDNEWRRSTSYVDAQQLFVGLEDVKLQLLNKLFEDEPRRCVVSICGMRGLGKTTLARSIYNSTQVISCFQDRAWICVSQVYTIQDLMRSVIKSFKKKYKYKELEMLEKMNVQDLEVYLREMLNDSRYLVVVDDVWEKVAWESLKRGFPDCGKGSRVIITTSNSDLARKLDETVYAHDLRFLNPEESWELFIRKLSLGRNSSVYSSYSPDMLDLGKKMVAKCRGLPLALVVLGGLLAHKQDLKEWQGVKKDIWSHLGNDIEISSLLSLSYNHLPRALRICFLYLCSFPEDYLIDAEELTYLWIAEQFIPSGEDMEEVAELYLNALVNRGLIHVEERLLDKIFKCRIHDLLRDLVIRKAFVSNSFGIHNPDKEHNIYNLEREQFPLAHKQRHVVHTQIQRYLSVDYSNKSLQSLLIVNHDREHHETPPLVNIFKSYKTLCVLKLERVELPNVLPDVIGQLEQLKFLGLLDTPTKVLPPSIGNLRSLQTLEVLPLDRTDCALPRETSTLTNLRHLICRMTGNPEIGSLSNLRTLKYIKYEHWLAIEKENLLNLRELVIEDIHRIHGRPYVLGPFTNFTRLHTLVLISKYFRELPPLNFLSSCQNLHKLWLEGVIEELPHSSMWPTSITVLKLAVSGFYKDTSPTLGKLPNLRRLDLFASNKALDMVFGYNSFPQLEILNLRDLVCLEKLILEDGAMPKIKRLHVSECPHLVDIPEKLRSILLPDEGERDLYFLHV